MRRSPLKRGKPLKQGQSQLKRSGGPARGKPIRRRSKRMAKVYRDQRVPFVKQLLAERPVCEFPNCRSQSVDVHEVKTRARGGALCDPENCRCLCRPHHDWIGDHPAEAHAMGLLQHSWEG